MKRTALKHTASFVGAPVLTRSERASDRLLVWVWSPGNETGGAGLIDAYVSEGWNVLEAGCGTASGSAHAAADIVEAVRQCGSASPADWGPTIFIADQDTAASVCKAVLLACREGLKAARCGLVTVDAFADDAVRPILEQLAALDGLAAIWAVHRERREIRQQALAHHASLQARGRETHFLVLPDTARSPVQRLADPRDPLGCETRWLLDPVHSRSV
ncbi:hypothetical protein [Bradyrhizobium sp. NP1]|uniref:hypothetical protein n=1 Tax=Bradyrhizobium sp. NP1 TaxID=3049772 RepID=UPI0025A64F46|nr:hypothetical protein [Bradyrhizobium sp. NP1]WJR76597.1 hypothetical protein QOU61_28115 [Bradyrhizobium sp. NP1]